ncbi:hypothetical protein EYF80_025596 [Liparis tanakae]|uniref:Uncharacterized protein n=1 Tax=Liparis tanakae TaxID=230148 RepID=A0A4Z2HEC1_9TELE|nr:hypothetical protein EYF80_025596 [Liparis tanakae]
MCLCRVPPLLFHATLPRWQSKLVNTSPERTGAIGAVTDCDDFKAFSAAKGAHRSSNTQLSVFTSKADESKTAELKQQRSLDMSLPVQRECISIWMHSAT